MRYISLVILFFHLSAQAQEWEIIDPEQIYYYGRSDSSGTVNSMRVEYSYSDSQYTYYSFHDNYIQQKDTCVQYYEETNEFWFPSDSICEYYYHDKGSLLGKTVAVDDSGNYWFNNFNNRIRPFAQQGEEWIFDEENDWNAVVGNTEATFSFGIPDSLKKIHIYANDTTLVDSIILSRNNGLFHLPFKDSTYFYCTGIQSNMNSDRMPRFEELFDMQLGDVLVFKHRHSEMVDIEPAGMITTARLEVISIDSVDGHEVYNCSMATRKQIFDQIIGISNGNTLATAEIQYDPYELYASSYSYPGEIAPMKLQTDVMNIDWWSPYLAPNGLDSIHAHNLNSSMRILNYGDVSSGLISSNFLSGGSNTTHTKLMIKGLNENYYTYPPFVSFASEQFEDVEARMDEGFDIEYFYYGMTFQEGLGLTYMGLFIFEAGESLKLIGAKRGEEIYGIVPSAAQILSTEEIELDLNIQAYPNPSSGIVKIDIEQTQPVGLKVYGMDGRLIRERELYFGINEIDISELQDQIYLFEYRTGKTISTERIIKL